MNSRASYLRKLLRHPIHLFSCFISLFGIVGATTTARAADDDRLKVTISPRSHFASFVGAIDGKPLTPPAVGRAAQETAVEFLQARGKLFGITDVANQLMLDSANTDTLGYTHSSFHQVHRGIPVFSGLLKVHQNGAGQVTCANGRFYPISDKVDTFPRIDSDTAEFVAKAKFPEHQTTATKIELVIVDPGWYGDPPRGARLAWYIHLTDDGFEVREAFFIDAINAEILDQWSLVHSARMRKIYNGGGGTSLPGTLSRSEGQGPVGTPADVNRVYDYLGDTYDYFFRAFGRDSINGLGMDIIATVNSTAPSPCPNAFWDPSRLQIVFCLGLVTDDVVAHEITHGVTQFTSNLIYQNQPGQLNESLSDIFGELIDLFNGNAAFAGTPGGTPSWPTHPTGAGLDTPNNLRTTGCSLYPSFPNGVRWMVGEDVTAPPFTGGIRDMWNPTCFSDPDRANSPLNTCNPSDNGGVHSGSGVPNHAFAIMTDGKNFNGQNVTGIGPIKAGAVWYRAQTQYLTVASDFRDAYDALIQAAADLIGTFPNDPRSGTPSSSQFTVSDSQQVEKALLAVEMHTPGACGVPDAVVSSDPAPICSDSETLLYEDFEGTFAGWETTISTPAPPTVYHWIQTTNSLPYRRSGKAVFCRDANIGNCTNVFERAVHSLTSPVITLPAVNRTIAVSFDHCMAGEGGWDGGLIRYSVNNAPFTTVPRNFFRHNPYNGRLNPTGSDNPLAGSEAWTGAAGEWGTTVIYFPAGTFLPSATLRLRFDFGKDSCYGVDGWYVDDVRVYYCTACEHEGLPDDSSNRFVYVFPAVAQVTSGTPRQFPLNAPPTALSDVKLTVYSSSLFGESTRFLNVFAGNNPAGAIFTTDAGFCSDTPDRAELIIPLGLYNASIVNNAVTFRFEPSSAVNGAICTLANTYMSCIVEFETIPQSCVPPPELILSQFADVGVCVGQETGPLGPEPLVTGGTPPYSYTWEVIEGSASFSQTQINEEHPTLMPTTQASHVVRCTIKDSSLPVQTKIATMTIHVGGSVTIDPGAYARYHPIVTSGEQLDFGQFFSITEGQGPYTIHCYVQNDPNNQGTITNADSFQAAFSAIEPGTYTIVLEVRDAGGCATYYQFSLTVVSIPPTSKTVTDGNGSDGGANGGSTTCGVISCAPMSLTTLVACALGVGMMRRTRLRGGRRR